MGLKLITAAGSEPITLAQLKAQCRVDTSDDDAVLTLAIAAARAKAENYTGTAIISQTWEQTLDAFPEAEIEILKPPVTSITLAAKSIESGMARATIRPPRKLPSMISSTATTRKPPTARFSLTVPRA